MIRPLLVCTILLVGWLAYSFEPNPLEYSNLPFPVRGPVQVGARIPMTIARCVDLPELVDVDFARSLVREGTSRSMNLGSGTAVILPGCNVSESATALVPLETTPGRYRVVGIVTIQGRLRSHQIRYQTEPFEVIP